MRLLLTRPQPAAGASAARLTALGHDVLVSPLLAPVAVDWTAPDTPPPALLLTSASAVRLGNLPAAWRDVPVFAVGSATAAAATAAGWRDVRDARGDVAAALALAVRSGVTRLLHVAGADRSDVAVPPGLTVDVATVYAARPAALSGDAVAGLAAGEIDAVLLYSPRTAAQFAAQADAAGVARAAIAIVALSAAVAAAAGDGWRDVAVAADPHEDALFAAFARLCDKAPDLQG